jgi:hypothetical protein
MKITVTFIAFTVKIGEKVRQSESNLSFSLPTIADRLPVFRFCGKPVDNPSVKPYNISIFYWEGSV